MPKSSHDTAPLFTNFALPSVVNFASAWKDVLCQYGVHSEYSSGSFVDAQNLHAFDLFYLASGTVRVIFDTLEGRMRSVVSFESGSIFNLAQAATRQEASGQYYCVSPCTVWRIPGKLLYDPAFISEHPDLILAVTNQLGHIVLTYHTYLTDMQMDNFIIRFSRFLLGMSTEKKSLNFACGMTQEHVATIMGVHRATLGRAIQELKKKGIISVFTANNVSITDIDQLYSIAQL